MDTFSLFDGEWLPNLIFLASMRSSLAASIDSLTSLLAVLMPMFLVETARDVLAEWSPLDSSIVLTAALAGMACALPGTFLVLRRQSLLGDALSHAVLPGIVLGELLLRGLEGVGLISGDSAVAWRPLFLFAGAAVTGLACAWLAQGLEQGGRLERSAALGVAYTSLFALGLLLLRAFADGVHIDLGCVLYGNLEATPTDRWGMHGPPRAAVICGIMLAANAIVLTLVWKELQLTTFDPQVAQTQGLPVQTLNALLLSLTGATVVAAFESVGSILVMAMLVAPAATLLLLSDRLRTVVIGSVVCAALTALLGHLAALAAPIAHNRFWGTQETASVSTAGMIAVVAGGLFGGACLASPKYGFLRRASDRLRLQTRILGEDVLGVLYRLEELQGDEATGASDAGLAPTLRVAPWQLWLALRLLQQQGYIRSGETGAMLTPTGREQARSLVRSHRLWEVYLARHFHLPDRRLHDLAETAEHFLSPQLQAELASELDHPQHDPHGAAIPRTEPVTKALAVPSNEPAGTPTSAATTATASTAAASPTEKHPS